MQSVMQSAQFASGSVTVKLSTSTMAGYINQCQQYSDYGYFAVPNASQLVNIDAQSMSNVVVTGYANRNTDSNFSIAAGENANCSNSWYQLRQNNGVFIQQANTSNKENEMMGQSTNHILLDMANLLVAIIDYLGTHTHQGGSYVAAGVPVTGVSGLVVSPPPNDSEVSNDIPRLTNGENLAGDNYAPY